MDQPIESDVLNTSIEIGRRDNIAGEVPIQIVVLGGKEARGVVAHASAFIGTCNDAVSYEVSAGSRLDDSDTYDCEIGELLAVGRALKHLGSRMTKRAHGLVEERDNLRNEGSLRALKKENDRLEKELDKRTRPRTVVLPGNTPESHNVGA